MGAVRRRSLVAVAGVLVALVSGSCAWPAGRVADRGPLGVLIAGLRSSDQVVRADAARLLGDLRAREAVGPLLEYVTTGRGYDKTAGLEALARIGDPAVCPRLRPLVNDPLVPDDAPWYGYSSVRVAAALALLSLGDESGVTFLQGLEDRSEADSDWDAGAWSLYAWFAPALLELPDTLASTRKLKQGLTFDKLFPKEKRDPGQIVVIARSLGLLGTPEALDKLVELLSSDSRYVRARAAVSLLTASPTPEHLAAVVRLAENDPTEFVRIKAAEALARADEGRYLPPIVKAAESAQDSLDRGAAVESLGLLGRRENVPVLLRQLRQADPFVRLSAVEALDRLGGGELVAREVAACRQDKSPRVRLYAAKFFATHGTKEKRVGRGAQALRVGVGACDISPAKPELLTPVGLTHAEPTRGVLDPLEVRALAFQAGGKTTLLVTGDQLFVDQSMEGAIAQAVAKQLGCEPPRVLVTCTHNHSSSAAPGAKSGAAGQKAAGEADRKVTDGFVQASVSACKNLRPAEIAAATVWLKEPVGEDRRMILANGGCMSNWGSALTVPGEKFWGTGPPSRRVDLLSIREPGQSKPFAILTSYATHPHLSGIPYFSGEFAGAARGAIEARVPGVKVVYTNSTAGDISLAEALVPPLQGLSSPEALQRFRDTATALGTRFAKAVVAAIPTEGYFRPESLLHGSGKLDYGSDGTGKVNVLLFDHIALAVIPGEMFGEYGDLMHARSPLRHLLLVGYSGDTAGYVVPPLGWEQGGYEPHRYPAHPERGREISEKVIEVVDQLVRARVGADQATPAGAAGRPERSGRG
jgi:HEAT repeat protein